MNTVHNGVLIPEDMRTANPDELDAYTATVKRDNQAFIRACFALEDAAERLGVELPS